MSQAGAKENHVLSYYTSDGTTSHLQLNGDVSYPGESQRYSRVPAGSRGEMVFRRSGASDRRWAQLASTDAAAAISPISRSKPLHRSGLATPLRPRAPRRPDPRYGDCKTSRLLVSRSARPIPYAALLTPYPCPTWRRICPEWKRSLCDRLCARQRPHGSTPPRSMRPRAVCRWPTKAAWHDRRPQTTTHAHTGEQASDNRSLTSSP